MKYFSRFTKLKADFSFNVEGNLDEFVKGSKTLQVQDIPRVIADTLTGMANDAVEDESKATLKQLDRPKPYTQRAFRAQRAYRNKFVSEVFVMRNQMKYLKNAIFGGEQEDTYSPRNIRLNQYGNIPGMRGGDKIEKLINQPDHFVAEFNGVKGVWRRYKNRRRKPKLVIQFVERKKYTPQFFFEDIAKRSGNKNFYPNFLASVKKVSSLKT